MTNIDVNALALYCDAYADYMACTKIIQEEGLLVEYTNKRLKQIKSSSTLNQEKQPMNK